jgi:hypothetical protein
MPKPHAARQGWKKLNAIKLNSLAGICINSIIAAPEYAAILTQATAALAVWDDYNEAMQKAQTGDRHAIAIKNTCKSVLAETMNNLAVEVNNVAKGRLEVLLLSLMPLVQTTTTPVVQQKPAGLQAKNGKNSGEIDLTLKEAVGARSVMFQYSLEPPAANTAWTSRVGRKKFTFVNLPSGTKVWFRVVSVGKNNVEIMSEVVSCYVC